jgi:hypothetical protein
VARLLVAVAAVQQLLALTLVVVEMAVLVTAVYTLGKDNHDAFCNT